MMEERLKILLDSGVITQEIYDKSFEIYKKYFEKEDFNKDKVNVFMTHFAMSLKRITEGNIIDKLDEDVYSQVTESEVYDEAISISEKIVKDLNMDIPKNEEEYFILHLGSILIERRRILKIVVGGQIDKDKIHDKIVELVGSDVQVDIKSDLEAAMAIKNNEYDYYVGACNTGGGGALAMAMALLGNEKCSTISMPGSIKSDSFIAEEVEKGKKAFGFTAQHADQVLPVLVNEILKN